MKKLRIVILGIVLVVIISVFYKTKDVYAALEQENSILYESHIENIGWQKEVTEGNISGTTGRSLQMEAIKISNSNSNFKISYQVHIENIGWQGLKKQGEIAGTTGKSLQIEAIKIYLENLGTNNYTIEYRAHVQNIGWQDWKRDGEISGTYGKGLAIEAMQIRITEAKLGVKYISHIENIGWEAGYTFNGETSGTTGKSLRNEAVKIELINNKNNEGIKYNAYIQGAGWTGWKQNGEMAGTTGKALRIEAMKIQLMNVEDYTIKYRLHISNIGWTSWKKDGEQVGTAGSGLQIEAVEIKIILKEEQLEDTNNITSSGKKGIDVSKYQGDIDWAKVKKSGVEFAMIRAGFRGYGTAGTLVTDTSFKTNMNGALENGIDVGVYFFSQAVNQKEAIEEANYVVNLVKTYKITYPIAIDTEDVPDAVGRADNLTKEIRTEVIAAFCKRIKELGYEPMIYANKWWLNEQLDMNKLSNYSVWLAHYTGATTDNPFAKPSDYKGSYIMWQYTDKATINGISTKVDANVTIPQN